MLWMPMLACGTDKGDLRGDDDDDDDTAPATTPPTTDPSPTTDSAPTTPADPVTEAFAPAPLPADILLVVDNSCSMADDQARAAAQIPALFGIVATDGLDWRMAFTTTDLDGNYAGSRGSLVELRGARWIDTTTPDPEAAFGAFVNLGTTGSSTEQGLGAAHQALEPAVAPDPDFRRPDASLHVLVLSDEPDLTRGIVPADFTTWYAAMVDSPEKESFSAFADPASGVRYADQAGAFAGVTQNLRDADWSAAIDDLAEIVLVVDSHLALSVAPDPATIEVVRTRGGADTPLVEGSGWTWNAALGEIVLTEEPEIGDTFTVTYVPG